MGQFHSPLCRIDWTNVTHGAQRFAFDGSKPLNLLFGLRFDPAFWTSFDSAVYTIELQVFQTGFVRAVHSRYGEIADLPGAPAENIWLGMSFGKARQATGSWTGLFMFRPQIWFSRFGPGPSYIPGEFAVAPEDHCFAVEVGGPPDGSEDEFERFIGGSGQPDL
jgi:hypothetical protein